MRDPVRHHYAPRFYLAGFLDDDRRVCVYEKGKPGGFRGSPQNVGLETNFYTVGTHDNPRDSKLVEDLMSLVDNPTTPWCRACSGQQVVDQRPDGHRVGQHQVDQGVCR